MNIKRFGTVYGGFDYPADLEGLSKDSIIYCVGAGEDISHDVILASQLNAKVHIFDPTPRAIDHVRLVVDVINNKRDPVMSDRIAGGEPRAYWECIHSHKINQETGGNLILHPYGLFTSDDVLNFYSPSNPEYVSCSLIRKMKSDKCTIKVPVKKLTTIMSELNHDTIDLLKIDIEGCECDVINQMLDDRIYPKYLSVDFDLGWNGERLEDIETCVNTIDRIKSNNYKVLSNCKSDYSFMLL